MRLNSEKCTFIVRVGKFLCFYLTERDIEANTDKCKAVIKMGAPTTKKEIMKLNGILMT